MRARRLLPLALALSLAGARAASALPTDTWLVAIGDDHGDGEDESLLYAKADAQLIVQTLEQEGGVNPVRVTELLDASAEQVRRTLQEINARIREGSAQRATTLLVFYSGHADAEALHLDGTQLKMDELKNLVAGSAAAMRLLIVDACRSGGVTRVKGMHAAEPFQSSLEDQLSNEGLAIITSSTAGESSQESDALRGSFFTHHFVNALRGAADENGDGEVTLAEAYAYAYSQTLRSSGRTLVLQHPTYSYDVKGKGEVVLSRPRDATGRVGRLRLPRVATYLISDKREGGPVVAEVSPVRADGAFTLPAGSYFVQERLPSEYREYQLALPPGGEISLGELDYRAVRYDRLVRKRGGDHPSVSGLYLLGGAHGQTLSGEGTTPQAILGYAIDLPWLTAGVRFRASESGSDGPGGLVPRHHDEFAGGLTIQRFIDFSELSAAFGLVVEAIDNRETFRGTRAAPTVHSGGASFGGSLTLERQLAAGLAFRIEGGPVTFVFNEINQASNGSISSVRASPFTWWGAGGLVWRL